MCSQLGTHPHCSMCSCDLSYSNALPMYKLKCIVAKDEMLQHVCTVAHIKVDTIRDHMSSRKPWANYTSVIGMVPAGMRRHAQGLSGPLGDRTRCDMLCCRQGKAAPATELLNAAEAAGVGPALLVTLAQAWPMAGAAWHADALGFTKDYVNRLSIAVGPTMHLCRDSDGPSSLRFWCCR